MRAPPLALVRAAAAELCRRHGVALVTPDSPSAVRSIVRATIAAATPLTTAEVEERVSFYVPRLADDVLQLARVVPGIAGVVDLEASAIYLGERAWNDGALLCGVVAHELGHHLQDSLARERAGVAGSVMHAAGYLIHETVRSNSEALCYECDLAAAVIFDGADPQAHMAGILAVLGSTYRLGAHAVKHAAAPLASAAASLAAMQLPGVGTPLHELLTILVDGGWDAGPWARAIGGAL